MLFSVVAETSARVARDRSRKAKIEALAELLTDLGPERVPVVCSFVVGAPRQGSLGVGPAAVRAAGRPAPTDEACLTVLDVDAALTTLAETSGPGSKAARESQLRDLLGAATEVEQDFLIRLILGEVRQGASEGVLVEAIARAADLPADDVRRAAMLGGELRSVATAALIDGAEGLAGFRLEVMRFVQPMLASSAPTPTEALERLGDAAFEWKLDGARVQVHRQGAAVRVFTRQGHDVTRAIPDVVEAALALDAESFVLDGEALVLEPDGRPRPFQDTMRRFGRRLEVEGLRRELPLSLFVFDALHLDGRDLLDLPARERWRAIEALVPEPLRAPRVLAEDPEAAEAFYSAALEQGHEGVVAKDPEAPYQAGRRGASWVKVKPAHTLDLVVLAAEWGSGRREGRLSNLHLGAQSGGDFVMLGKTFKGMTDEILDRQTEELLALETRREGHVVHVRPELVVEVAFDGVQRSPQYPGGVALRFARLRRYRDDKSAAEADSLEAVTAFLGGAGA